MKRIMLVGRISCGKTTLGQRLYGQTLTYKKTQTIELVGEAIDTPGEYMENRKLMNSLIVSAVDADLAVLLQSCTDEDSSYSPGQASMFSCPVIGVVTKIDLAPDRQSVANAKELLELAGAEKVFAVSAITGEGMREFAEYLQQ